MTGIPPPYPGADPPPRDPNAPGYGAPVPGPPGPPPAPSGPVAPAVPGGWYQGADGQWYQAAPPTAYPTHAPYGAASPYPTQPSTNGFAVAALVCSIAAVLCGVGAILGIVFGFIARSQIRRSGGTEKGAGMALAGIIIGFALIAALVIFIVVAIALGTQCGGVNQQAC